MPYMIQLTFPQAVKLGTIGVVCLGAGYACAKIAHLIDRVGRNQIQAAEADSVPGGNHVIAPMGSGEKALKLISTIASLVLSILAFLLWMAGAACITYSVVGPLL